MHDEEIGKKIWNIMYPPLIYLIVNIFIQVAFMIFVFTLVDIKGGFFDGANILQNIDEKIQGYSLYVTIISALISIGILYRFVKIDIVRDLSKRMDKSYILLIPLAFFANTGLSRFINLFSTNPYVKPDNFIMQVFALALILPIMEEIIFRMLVYKRLKEYTKNIYAASIVSAFLFGLYHFNLLQGIYAFTLGLILNYIYEKYNNITGPILLHILANFMAISLNYSGISNFLSRNIFIYLLLMIVEILALVYMLYKISGRKK